MVSVVVKFLSRSPVQRPELWIEPDESAPRRIGPEVAGDYGRQAADPVRRRTGEQGARDAKLVQPVRDQVEAPDRLAAIVGDDHDLRPRCRDRAQRRPVRLLAGIERLGLGEDDFRQTTRQGDLQDLPIGGQVLPQADVKRAGILVAPQQHRVTPARIALGAALGASGGQRGAFEGVEECLPCGVAEARAGKAVRGETDNAERAGRDCAGEQRGGFDIFAQARAGPAQRPFDQEMGRDRQAKGGDKDGNADVARRRSAVGETCETQRRPVPQVERIADEPQCGQNPVAEDLAVDPRLRPGRQDETGAKYRQ